MEKFYMTEKQKHSKFIIAMYFFFTIIEIKREKRKREG